MTFAVRLQDLSVSYPDGTRAVESLTFALRDGESAALIGANGAGKTSLLLALAGVLPASGQAEICGVMLNEEERTRKAHTTRAERKKTLDSLRRAVGLVFQNPDDQLFMPTVFEDLAFGPRNFGLPEEEAGARAESALRALKIEHLRDRSPLRLSGGEKRAAAIATVLSMEPRLLLFDEPTAFLDPRARRALIATVRGLPQAKLIATHDLTFAMETCTRALILKEGRLRADGSPEELFRDRYLMEAGGLEAL